MSNPSDRNKQEIHAELLKCSFFDMSLVLQYLGLTDWLSAIILSYTNCMTFKPWKTSEPRFEHRKAKRKKNLRSKVSESQAEKYEGRKEKRKTLEAIFEKLMLILKEMKLGGGTIIEKVLPQEDTLISFQLMIGKYLHFLPFQKVVFDS